MRERRGSWQTTERARESSRSGAARKLIASFALPASFGPVVIQKMTDGVFGRGGGEKRRVFLFSGDFGRVTVGRVES